MRRGILLRSSLALLLAGFASTPAVSAWWTSTPAPVHEVRDPYYGVSLYDFYQDRYFSALSDLLVAEHFGRLSHNVDEEQLLRAGLCLSYGMHREAAEIFTRLLGTTASPAVRDRAWFYLAKIRYQRGLLPEAEQALAQIHDRLAPGLEAERVLLLGNVLMARGDYAGAAAALKKAAALSGDEALYARFNLGVALIRNGDLAKGSELLDEIGVIPARTEEYRSLRDKADVALGFAAIQNKDPERARVYLARVRLTSMMANKALLGFGWAADALHQPKDALVPWTELAGRDISDLAVLEAKLAVPYALAETGSYGLALEGYGKAIAAFEQERANLDESVAAIRSGKLLADLLAANPGEEMGWFWNIDRLPQMPHAAHLAQVLALHEFQEAFKNYRDLQFLERNLHDWEGRTAVLSDMLANRQQAFAERLPPVRNAERGLNIDALEVRRNALDAELARARKQADGRDLASAQEMAIGARLDRIQDLLAAGGIDPQAQELARERYRRVAGAFSWQLAQEMPARLWEARKDLQRLNDELQRARSLDADLVRAQRDEPAHLAGFAQRIELLRARIRALQPRVDALLRAQGQAVQELAVATLMEQKERLVNYTNQARFAVAQIYDRAGGSGNAAHAPATK